MLDSLFWMLDVGLRMLRPAGKVTPGKPAGQAKTVAYCVCRNATFGPRIMPACA